MSDGLDAPTVFRAGAPTLGQPVMALNYRPLGDRGADRIRRVEASPVATQQDIALLQAQLNAHEVRLRALERPWPQRLWAWVRSWWGA